MALFAKIYLLINVLVWVSYGLACTVFPELFITLGVYELGSWVEKTEVRAMYGGAQLAFGLLAALTLLNMKRHLHTSLLFFVLLFSGLALVRAAGMVMDGPGLGLDITAGTDPEGYNGGALWFFELPMLAMSLLLYRHFSRHPFAAQ